jgi:zinc protease
VATAVEPPEIPFEKYTLPNGLEVILHEDHAVPMVSVNVWYHVGSKNEKPRRTGFAHLFEHMMFQGSENHDGDYFEPLEKIGGVANGSTSEDRTNYWEDVPSNYLEMALWLEADRMGFLLPAMTQEKLDNQRDVVKNERRQGLDNQPYAKAEEISLKLLYPNDHPYSWPVIGSMEDLSAAEMEDVKGFFRSYYTPNNASLCIAGDFEPEATKALVEKYFGSIPPGPPVERLAGWVPELEGERRMVAEDNVNLPRLYVMWHTPAYYASGDAELDLLANVLTSGKNSRLYRSLVYDAQIAQDVTAYQASNELGSVFKIIVTAREGHGLEEIEEAVNRELKEIMIRGITEDELIGAKNSSEAYFVRSLQAVGGFGGRADALNRYNVFLGDPGMLQWDMNRYQQATVGDVNDVAARYLHPEKRAVLHVVPQGELSIAEKPVALDRSAMPGPAQEPTFSPPEIQRATLKSGLELFVVEDHRLPMMQVNVVLKSGWAADPADRFGAASLTAELLDEGTRTRTALQISDEAKRLGANLGTGSFFDASFIGLNVLEKNVGEGMELLADVLLNPTFPTEELERQRKLYLGRIQQEQKEPFTSALKTYLTTLYGEAHPYGQPFTGSGTHESVEKISRDDLVKFYKANYHPNNAAVVIAGDLTLAEAKKLVDSVFKGWKPGDVAPSDVPDPDPLETTRIAIIDKPGAAQSVIVVGHLGIRRKDPDYIAVNVMNNAFGGQFTSRINMNLREDKGYSYGAGSFFFAPRGVGPLLLFAPVQTDRTSESLTEIVKEMREVIGSRPLTDTEIVDSKNNLIKSFPQNFQTCEGVANQVVELIMYDLTLDEWQTYVDRVKAVDGTMATEAARDHLHPDALLVVVVGDRKKIEPELKSLELGEIIDLSPAG